MRRWPDPDDNDHLATITAAGPHEPTRDNSNDHRSLRKRRTERRLAPAIAVPRDALVVLRERAGGAQTVLHHLGVDQLPILALAAKVAQERETSDSRNVAELREWERRNRFSVMRVVVDAQPTPPPATPRRPASEYIDTEPRG